MNALSVSFLPPGFAAELIELGSVGDNRPPLSRELKAQLERWRGELMRGSPLYLELGVDAERVATELGEGLGRLLDVYGDGQRWSSLTVSLDAAPNRTHGVGANPLHIDYVQRSHPPDLIMLLGEREDPLGGGASVLARFEAAREGLSLQDQELLAMPVLRYWNDQGAQEVGEPLERFALFDGAWTRFTSKMLPHLDGSATVFAQDALADQARIRDALLRFDALLQAHSYRARLRPGQLLIFSQRHFAHGREALGFDQANLPQRSRRLLRQAYIRLLDA